ncbi:basic proline-rich protein-like [Iris pallida]|uniref:Basic proline-rich protein-like n=1 Tax=Iris pallida TaxID=29817 RepID=A0AAX6E1T9_IRIPA|nr:basic proline-rich protein-like [Iris pallida]
MCPCHHFLHPVRYTIARPSNHSHCSLPTQPTTTNPNPVSPGPTPRIRHNENQIKKFKHNLCSKPGPFFAVGHHHRRCNPVLPSRSSHRLQ